MASLPSTMKAVGFTEYGTPAVLKTVEVPVPTLLPRDALIKVHAVSVNPTDVKRRTNWAKAKEPITAPRVVGYDGSGVIASLGSEAHRFNVGDEVYFAGNASRQGSYAEYLAIDERTLGRKPKSTTFSQAAAEPLTALTAFEALYEAFALDESNKAENAKKSILIVAGAGGVGSIAIQIAKKLLNLITIATASRAESAEYCKKLGADFIVDHRKPMGEQIATALGGTIPRGGVVDYVLNCADLDAGRLQEFTDILKPLGKLCIVSGANEPIPVNFGVIMSKRLSIIGELMYTRPIFDVEQERHGQFLERLAGLLEDGTFESRMTREFNSLFDDIQEAHRLQETGSLMGKTALWVVPKSK